MATAEALLTAEEYGLLPDNPTRVVGPDDDLVLPEILGDFRVPVRRFFE
jgi:hypothetical protein